MNRTNYYHTYGPQRHGHGVRFQITRAIFAVTVVLTGIWLLLSVTIPREKTCTVDYYGPPNVTIMADDILQAQIGSYHSDYNYYRYVMNHEWDCISSEEVHRRISNTMVEVLNGQLMRDEALSIVEAELQQILTDHDIAELRLIWTMTMTDALHDEYANVYGSIREDQCHTVFNISTGYPYVRGDNLSCYVMPGTQNCDNVRLEIPGTAMGFYKALTKVLQYLWGFLTFVVALALTSRTYRRIIKAGFMYFLTMIGAANTSSEDSESDRKSGVGSTTRTCDSSSDKEDDNDSEGDSDDDSDDDSNDSSDDRIEYSHSEIEEENDVEESSDEESDDDTIDHTEEYDYYQDTTTLDETYHRDGDYDEYDDYDNYGNYDEY